MASWQYKSDPNNTNVGQLDQGYYVKLPDTPADDFSPSAFLTNKDNDTLGLWITNAEISFQLAGSTGQSIRLREFYPRNFVQAKWTIQGIVANSFEYQRLAEFVRSTQFDAINPAGIDNVGSHLPALTIYAGHLGQLSKLTAKQRSDLNMGDTGVVQGKGPHERQHMRGFIENISRGAERFINAPTYSFDFNVIFSFGHLLYTQNWGYIYQKTAEPKSIDTSDLGNGQIYKGQPPSV